MPNKNELEQKLNGLKTNLDEFNININNIIEKFNTVKDYYEKY